MSTTTASTITSTEQLLTVATARLEAELRDCRAEASCECSEPLRSWFDGRTQGLEDALRVLEQVLQPRYQRRA